ncbi:MAG: multi-sensor signal transduction histidine kinase [Deltaproteobacteria bacterium]|nr:multi-sensor signal transduction histidine kinase [Deltaproteobacteria bacterium]
MRSTILLVDDEKEFRDSSQRLLTRKGYDVLTAENGERALDFLSKNPVDVILLDLKMPVMGGEEFLRAKGPLYPDIPVVVITGHGSLDVAVECMRKGAYDFITKPFDLSQLFLSIERALEKRSLERKAKSYQEETVQNLLALSTEKKRLETIISCIANGIMVTNKNLEVVLYNPALLRLLEVRAPAASPAPVHAIVKDQALIETLKQIQGGEPLENGFVAQEIRVGERVLRAISAPTLEPERRVFWTVAGAVTVLEDITLFKQLDQMKSEFVNMVAHELRSPLVSIRQIQSVLAEGLAGPLSEKQEDFVKRGMKKIDALLALINDLLDVARLEAGRLVQKQTVIDLSEMIEDMVLLMQLRAKEQGLVLTHSCENMKPVVADPKNIEEVLNNLLTNAINYSPEGGKVTVTARGVGQFVEIKVSDTGVGIAPEELPKIFGKFYRVKHPKTRQVTGTGLGLSIVKGIVEAYRGSIHVESVPNQGTTFTVLLPAVQGEPGTPSS